MYSAHQGHLFATAARAGQARSESFFEDRICPMIFFSGIFALVFGAIGFWLRPDHEVYGKLDFITTITRGAWLEGLDRVMISHAETSFYFLAVGITLALFAGCYVGYHYFDEDN